LRATRSQQALGLVGTQVSVRRCAVDFRGRLCASLPRPAPHEAASCRRFAGRLTAGGYESIVKPEEIPKVLTFPRKLQENPSESKDILGCLEPFQGLEEFARLTFASVRELTSAPPRVKGPRALAALAGPCIRCDGCSKSDRRPIPYILKKRKLNALIVSRFGDGGCADRLGRQLEAIDVMPGIVPGIHAGRLRVCCGPSQSNCQLHADISPAKRYLRLDVDGRDKPGHEGGGGEITRRNRRYPELILTAEKSARSLCGTKRAPR
jgi:hypothetical protein